MAAADPSTALAVLLAAVCIDLCGVALVVPLLPHYAQSLDLSPGLYGVLQSMYGITQLLGAPIMGAISDTYGRKQVLIISCVGTAIAYLATGFATSVPMLFASRLLVGFVKQTTTAAHALVSDLTTHGQRAKALGHVHTAISVAFIVFPPLGGWLSKSNKQLPVLLAACCFGIELLLLWFITEPQKASSTTENKQKEKPKAGGWLGSVMHHASQQARAAADNLRQPELRILLLLSLLRKVAEVSQQFASSLSIQQRFGLGPESTGYVFSYRAILNAAVTAFAVQPLVKRFEPTDLLLRMGLLAAAAEFLGAVVSFEGWVALAPLAAIGYGVSRTCTVSCMTTRVPGDQLGSLLGVAGSLESATRIVVPLFSGFLTELMGPAMPNYLSALSFALVSAIVYVRPLCVGVKLYDHPDEHEPRKEEEKKER